MTKDELNVFFKNHAVTLKGVTIKYHNVELTGYFEFSIPIDKKDKYSFICTPSKKKITILGSNIEEIIIH